MKFFGFLIGAVLVGLSILFLAASAVANAKPRLIVGGVLLAGGIVIILTLAFRRKRPAPEAGYKNKTVIAPRTLLSAQSGDRSIRCRRCGEKIAFSDIRTRTREDGEFVECPHCGASFELEEES